MAKKETKKDLVVPKMLSVREDQWDRIAKIAEKEDRSMRSLFERMLDKYEGKLKCTK